MSWSCFFAHGSLFRSCNGELNVGALINIGTETNLHHCTLHRGTWEGENLDFIKIELPLLHFFIPNEHVYKVSMNKSKFKLILDFWLFWKNTGVKVLYLFYMYVIHYLFKINVSLFFIYPKSPALFCFLFLLFYFGHVSRQCYYNDTISSLHVMSLLRHITTIYHVSPSEFFKENKLHKVLIEKVIFGTSCSISIYTLFNRESFFKFILLNNRLF